VVAEYDFLMLGILIARWGTPKGTLLEKSRDKKVGWKIKSKGARTHAKITDPDGPKSYYSIEEEK
jgi:hypothetical protein